MIVAYLEPESAKRPEEKDETDPITVAVKHMTPKHELVDGVFTLTKFYLFKEDGTCFWIDAKNFVGCQHI